jgi:hypothetical protein
MSTCKYCGHETGAKMFCEYCGAKVDKAPVAPQPQMPPMPQPPMPQQVPQSPAGQPAAYQQPVMQDPRFQQGVYQPPVLNQMPVPQGYYTPRSAAGFLAGNIIVLVLSCIFFCGLFPLVSIPLSIIGIVFSVKAKNSRSEQEEKACRMVAMIMMIIGIFFLILGIVVFCGVVYDKYGSFGAFWDDMMNG